MAKTLLYIATSLDGYVARPNDEVEWLNRYNNVDFGLKEFEQGWCNNYGSTFL